MTTRRKILFTLATGALAPWSTLAQAQSQSQTPTRIRRIGWIIPQDLAGANAPWIAALRLGMAELKWVEGRDYQIDIRSARSAQDLPGIADELVASQPDLLFAPGDVGVRLFMQRTKTLPIVFAISVDPVGNGLIASLQRPGGNATGMTNLV